MKSAASENYRRPSLPLFSGIAVMLAVFLTAFPRPVLAHIAETNELEKQVSAETSANTAVSENTISENTNDFVGGKAAPQHYVILPVNENGEVLLPGGNTLTVGNAGESPVVIHFISPSSSTEAPSVQIPHSDGNAASEKYIRRIEQWRHSWEALIPTHSVLQYAGSMGAASTGLGWEYGYYGGFRHVATDLQLGLVPKFSSDKAHLSLTLKQDFFPLFVRISKSNFYIAPANFGMYITTIFGDDFWTREPDKYPTGYYWFSTRMRLNMYMGQSVSWVIPNKKRQFAASIALFYELSVNDFGFIQYVSNTYLKFKDILHLSFGLKTQWL